MNFGTLLFFSMNLDFPNAAKKQSRPADTGAHDTPDTTVKNKECWDTPRVNKADTAIFSSRETEFFYITLLEVWIQTALLRKYVTFFVKSVNFPRMQAKHCHPVFFSPFFPPFPT